MDHVVNVSFVPNGGTELVFVDPPILPEPNLSIVPGDTVTWLVEGQREVQVIFPQVRDLPTGLPRPGNPMGPFSDLSVSNGQVVGVIRQDVPIAPPSKRFLCQFFSEGKALAWANPIEGEAAALGGGLDVPMKPPG